MEVRHSLIHLVSQSQNSNFQNPHLLHKYHFLEANIDFTLFSNIFALNLESYSIEMPENVQFCTVLFQKYALKLIY